MNVKSDQKEGRREDEKQKVNYIHILDTISASKNLVFGKQLYLSNNKVQYYWTLWHTYIFDFA